MAAENELRSEPQQGELDPVVDVAPVDAEAPPARRRIRTVSFMGRALPRADWIERGFWAILLLCCVGCLYLAAFVLEPDTRGIGTHEQIGLPACGFVVMSGGFPCPSCGFTTTFALAAHARPIDSLLNQPFGFFLFVLTVLGAFALPVVAAKGISLFALTDRWPWWRIAAGLFGGWMVAWVYKCQTVVGLL